MSCAKTAEAIEMPFGLSAEGTMCWMGVLISPCEGAIFRGKNVPRHSRQHCAIICAQTAKPIEIPFVLWTRVGLKEACVTWGTLVQPGEYD